MHRHAEFGDDDERRTIKLEWKFALYGCVYFLGFPFDSKLRIFQRTRALFVQLDLLAEFLSLNF